MRATEEVLAYAFFIVCVVVVLTMDDWGKKLIDYVLAREQVVECSKGTRI